MLPLEYTFRERIRDAQRLGCGLFMTEFGGSPYFGYEWSNQVIQQYLQNQNNWEYKNFYAITGVGNSFFDPDTGEFMDPGIPFGWAEPFIHAVQGKTIPFSIRTFGKNGTFWFSYYADPGIKAGTEVLIQRSLWYPNNFTITISPAGKATWSLVQQMIQINLTSSANFGDYIHVRVDNITSI